MEMNFKMVEMNFKTTEIFFKMMEMTLMMMEMTLMMEVEDRPIHTRKHPVRNLRRFAGAAADAGIPALILASR